MQKDDKPEQPDDLNPFNGRAENGKNAASLLTKITVNKRRRPIYAVLYGPAGIGKSTFGASSEKPIFIQAERGLDQLTVPRFPLIHSLDDYKRQILTLVNESHDYETIVIDTIDGLDLLVQQAVCDEGKCASIEAYGGGYGKGFTRMREYWQKILDRLTDMSERWNVLLLSHAQIKTITDPSVGTPFDQWKLRMGDKSQDLVKQSVDMILFANLSKTIDKENPRAKKGRALVSGDREMWTSPATGVEAKNRFKLPSPMPFEWAALKTAVDKFYN
jgi:hypothetical protein